MPEHEGHDIEISVLTGGITNKLYRVKASDTGDYVVRVYGQKTELFIDRDAETETMQLLEPHRISPKVVKYMPDQNITIIEFIKGYTLKNDDFLKEELWENIVRPIQITHRSGVTISKVSNPIVDVKHLYKVLQGANNTYPEFDIDGTIKVLEKIYEVSSISEDQYVICHNDLLADNFHLIEDHKRDLEPICLLDWEYAGMNTVYYEIADMFQEILVSREIEGKLLDVYWEGKDPDYNIYMTDLFKPFPDIYWFLWSLIQLNFSSIEFDYYTYGKVKYDNAQENIKYLRENYDVKI